MRSRRMTITSALAAAAAAALAIGCGDSQGSRDGPVLAAPLLEAHRASPASAALSWSTVPGATGYDVLRKNLSSTVDYGYDLIYEGLSDTSAADTDLYPGFTYSYRVYATVGGQAGALSNLVVLLGVPSNVKAWPDPTLVNAAMCLSWDNAVDAASYNIYRNSPGTSQVVRSFVPDSGGPLNTEDYGLASGTTYTYRISAIFDGVEGILSDPVSATTK